MSKLSVSLCLQALFFGYKSNNSVCVLLKFTAFCAISRGPLNETPQTNGTICSITKSSSRISTTDYGWKQ